MKIFLFNFSLAITKLKYQLLQAFTLTIQNMTYIASSDEIK